MPQFMSTIQNLNYGTILHNFLPRAKLCLCNCVSVCLSVCLQDCSKCYGYVSLHELLWRDVINFWGCAGAGFFFHRAQYMTFARWRLYHRYLRRHCILMLCGRIKCKRLLISSWTIAIVYFVRCSNRESHGYAELSLFGQPCRRDW